MLETESTKTCFKCGELKTLSMFYKHPKMSDGHVNKCKECNKKDVQENYRVNIEHFKAYDKKRYGYSHRVDYRKSKLTGPHGPYKYFTEEDFVKAKLEKNEKAREQYKTDSVYKEKVLESKQKWCDANNTKRSAHHAVNNAVRDGKLTKPSSCTKCGKSGCTIYGHHWSYLPEHQLDVLWVCSSCHGKEHRKL